MSLCGVYPSQANVRIRKMFSHDRNLPTWKILPVEDFELVIIPGEILQSLDSAEHGVVLRSIAGIECLGILAVGEWFVSHAVSIERPGINVKLLSIQRFPGFSHCFVVFVRYLTEVELWL